jgi:hypothetical protein
MPFERRTITNGDPLISPVSLLRRNAFPRLNFVGLCLPWHLQIDFFKKKRERGGGVIMVIFLRIRTWNDSCKNTADLDVKIARQKTDRRSLVDVAATLTIRREYKPGGKSLGLKYLLFLWFQVRALWLFILWPLEAYMVINFRTRGISRGACKLTRTIILN